MTCAAFSIKFAKTNQKFAENSEFCEKKSLLLVNYSLQSLVRATGRLEVAGGGARLPPERVGRAPLFLFRRAEKNVNFAIEVISNLLILLRCCCSRACRGASSPWYRGHDACESPGACSGPRSGKLKRARSLLYRSQNLQVNLRLKALAEIYTKYSFALL